MEVPPPGPPGPPQDSPALILMQMKNSTDERTPSSSAPILPPPPTPSSLKLSHILSQSPPQGMHPQLPPPPSFNFNYNYPMNMMLNPPPLPLSNVPPPLRIPRLSLPVDRPSSAPGSPQGPSSLSPHSPSTPSSAPTTPISSPKDNRKQVECKLKHCLLCERGQPSLLVKAPTWASIMRGMFCNVSFCILIQIIQIVFDMFLTFD